MARTAAIVPVVGGGWNRERKITGGSRSESGAQAWAILASVMRTAEQQGRDVVDTIKTLLRASWAGENIALLTDTC